MKNANKFPQLKNSDITYFGYRAEPYLASGYIGVGLSDKKNNLKYFGLKNTLCLIQVNYDFFNYKPAMEKFSKELLKKIKKSDKKYIDTVVKQCLNSGQKLLKLSEKVGKTVLNTNPNSTELVKLLKSYSECAYEYCVFYIVAWFEKPERELAERLAEKYVSGINSKEKILSLICTPSRETAAEYEQDDFLKMCSKKSLPKKFFLKLCESHARKYGWLSIRYFIGKPWTTHDVFERAKNIKHSDAEKQYKERLLNRQKTHTKLVKILSQMSLKDRNLVKQIRDIIYLRTQRSDFFHYSNYFVLPLFKKIAASLNINYEDLLYFSPDEVVAALENKFELKKNFNERRSCLVAFFDGNSKIIQGKKAKDYIKRRPVLQLAFQKARSVSGISANPGIVSGKAKIIMKNEDLEKVSKNDILVTTMTTPNFISAMEKASAFITDEGGILCHAAIISREMKKPCIIGTKIATKVFKDGDIIEVDANKGIVKKLK